VRRLLVVWALASSMVAGSGRRWCLLRRLQVMEPAHGGGVVGYVRS
jgi:hypothetical protein